MTRLVHLSDLHLGPLAGFSPVHWNVKRALGYINWRRRRRHVHSIDLVNRMVAHVREKVPEQWLITGDLINIGLPAEYELAARWLASCGPPDRVAIVPGNHDIYTRLWTDQGIERWRPYMMSDAWGETALGAVAGFPFVRRIDDVCVIGVNSAVPTPPGFATGLIGRQQLRELQRVLIKTGAEGLFRLVMVHHPPVPGLADRTRRLRDAHDLQDVLEVAGAELVIYGHNHVDRFTWLETVSGGLPIVGVASASASQNHRMEGLGRYNLYEVERTGEGWAFEISAHGLSEPRAGIVELSRQNHRLRRVNDTVSENTHIKNAK